MNARLNPFFDPSPQGGRNSVTFPHGFLDFLTVSPGRRHRIGDYELEPERLERFNRALRELSAERPAFPWTRSPPQASAPCSATRAAAPRRSCNRGWRP